MPNSEPSPRRSTDDALGSSRRLRLGERPLMGARVPLSHPPIAEAKAHPLRAGLRLQLVTALGVLAMLAFVPLYLAVASLTRHTLRENREEVARAMGRAVAGRIADDVQAGSDKATLREVAEVSLEVDDVRHGTADPSATAGSDGVVAVRIVQGPNTTAPLSAIGVELLAVGDINAIDALRAQNDDRSPGERSIHTVAAIIGPILDVEVAESGALVQVALRVGDQASRAAPLLKLVAFYTAGFAVVLIVFAYLLLTRLIVRPIAGLLDATARLEEGAIRRLDPSLLMRGARGGAREVVELGRAIARATSQLADREETLAAKVRQLEEARADLLAARDAIIRSERLASVGRLSAGLAHEIGNPIAALLGLQDVLSMGELDEESRDLVARMKRETERVHRVLRDLLDFARADHAPSSIETIAAATHVRDVVDEVLALLTPQRALRDVSVDIAIPPSLPAARIGGAQLQQVLLNLVLNAADAIGGREGGRDGERDSDRSASTRGRIVISASNGEPGTIRIDVVDDGPGVPETVVAMLFEPFVTTKEPGKGTGLGLAVCRGLVEGVGGSIDLMPPDRGTHGAHFAIVVPTVDGPPVVRRSVPAPAM